MLPPFIMRASFSTRLIIHSLRISVEPAPSHPQSFSDVFFLFPSPQSNKEGVAGWALPRPTGNTLFITLGGLLPIRATFEKSCSHPGWEAGEISRVLFAPVLDQKGEEPENPLLCSRDPVLLVRGLQQAGVRYRWGKMCETVEKAGCCCIMPSPKKMSRRGTSALGKPAQAGKLFLGRAGMSHSPGESAACYTMASPQRRQTRRGPYLLQF